MSMQSAAVTQLRDIVAACALEQGLTQPIGDDESLVDKGITSITLVSIMLSIECKFDLLIPDHDLNPTNFYSMKKIAEMIWRITGKSVGDAPSFSERAIVMCQQGRSSGSIPLTVADA